MLLLCSCAHLNKFRIWCVVAIVEVNCVLLLLLVIMDSTKGTKRKTASGSTSKTPDTEADKTIDEESGSDANEESGNVVERARPPSSPTSRLGSFEAWRDGVDTWISKSDAWREKTDDKLKALTDVLLETRELLRSLSRHPDTYQAPPAELDVRAQPRAAPEEASASKSKSLDSGDPEEIKEDDYDDEEGDEAESKFSKSRKELKKLLERSNSLHDSDADEEEEDDEDHPTPPTLKLSKRKKKNGDDTIPGRGSALKKIDRERKGSKITPSSGQGMTGASSAQGPVKEEEIRAVFLQRSPLTTFELVDTFKARLKSPEDKNAFAEIMKRISKIQKTSNNQNYVVLRK